MWIIKECPKFCLLPLTLCVYLRPSELASQFGCHGGGGRSCRLDWYGCAVWTGSGTSAWSFRLSCRRHWCCCRLVWAGVREVIVSVPRLARPARSSSLRRHRDFPIKPRLLHLRRLGWSHHDLLVKPRLGLLRLLVFLVLVGRVGSGLRPRRRRSAAPTGHARIQPPTDTTALRGPSAGTCDP